MRIAFLAATGSLVLATPVAAQQVNTVRDALEHLEAARLAESANPAPPVPATDPGTWVRSEDYPAWAAAGKVTGRVAIVVDVDASGRVTRCEVSESSGVADFDRLACEKVSERAQFRPARDEQGNPVAGQWQNRVVWALPEQGPQAIPQAGGLAVTLVVERDGSVSKCAVERAEGAAAEATSAALCNNIGSFQPPLDDEGEPQRVRIRLVTSVERQPLP
jgi:TonB family protein